MSTSPPALSDLYAALEVASIKPDKPINLPAAARYYAAVLKWPVFPLKARGKSPLFPSAHRPEEKSSCRGECGRVGHGLYDATRDVETVVRWWTEHPEANIGIPTGPAPTGCGLDVIDADGPEGVAAWMKLKHRLCEPGCSAEAFCDATGGFVVLAEAFTPGNSTVGKGPGRHVFVKARGRGNAARMGGQPIDRRGAGGYVVGVPSVNLVGAAYTWLQQPTPAAS